MNHRSSAVCVILLCLLIGTARVATADPPVTQEVDRTKVCMLQDRMQKQAGLEQPYQGRTYYLCCPMCKSTFESDPEKYSKARDPVTGLSVDKATAPVIAHGDQAYFFASEESRAAFAKDPERYLHGAAAEQNKP